MENQSKIADLWLAELGLLGGNHDVAHHRELAAAAQREAVHRGDGGDLAVGDGGPGLARELLGDDGGERLRAQLGDVGAGGEGPAAAGDDDAAAGRVGLAGVQYHAELREQLVAQGVEGLGAVQRDDADAAVHLGQHHRRLGLGGGGRLEVSGDGVEAAEVSGHGGRGVAWLQEQALALARRLL